MAIRSLPTLILAISPLLLVPGLRADDWHADDETFDPEVQWVVVDDASRLGDPTPFYKDGNPTRSFTVIESKPDDKGGATVNFSLVVPFVQGQSTAPEGGALFMTMEQTEKLVSFLNEALASPDEAKEIGKVFEDGYYQQYTVIVDPAEKGPVVLKHEMNGALASFRFDVSPAKKLIDTLQQRLEEAKKIEAGSQ